MKRWRWLLLGLALILALTGGAVSRATPDPAVSSFLNELYTQRSEALLTGRPAANLERYYDLGVQSGRFALAHEEGRIAYMQSWAPARGLKVVAAEAVITNLRVKVSGQQATVSLIARTRLAYQYDGQTAQNEMGIGSWHWLQLTRGPKGWQVQKEFFLDALGSEWTEPFVPKTPLALKGAPVPAAGGRIDRAGAVAYAEQYCGAAWGCGNNSDYNQRYRSYRTLGGDCANFASQILVEGGHLKPDWAWRHDKAGSTCWVNAQAFVQYLTGSGKATLLARGTYPKVVQALDKLQPGDIVGYQVKGTITHVSVVTGRDSAHTPIVAAHTADRFRNPWDLGWDRDTIFWLLHVRD